MSDPIPRPNRKPRLPLMDRLGELCLSGRGKAAYLWQVPDDAGVRKELADLLVQIKEECAKVGRREMARIVDELTTALSASPSPQQVEILGDGFDRLMQLWQAAKSGLM